MEVNKKILCIHQGYEMYGSDKMFLCSVDLIRKMYPSARIDVIIPKHGDLYAELCDREINVFVEDFFVLRKSGFYRNIFMLPYYIFKSTKKFLRYDFVYINTIVVFDYLISSLIFQSKSLVHVHEIPTGIAKAVFSTIISLRFGVTIFNSQQTLRSISGANRSNYFVIDNGVDVKIDPQERDSKKTSKLNILLIGRINSWKGQDLLVEAISLLEASLQQEIHVRIVGGAFENAPHHRNLLLQIESKRLSHVIEVLPFSNSPAEQYKWSDIIVIPSKRPEPFGLVAIEAMAFSKPVVAANHGGLQSIVTNGETGWLVKPNSAESLADAIKAIVEGKGVLPVYGAKSREKYLSSYSLQAYEKKLSSVLLDRFEQLI